jgi:hypothetical protein
MGMTPDEFVEAEQKVEALRFDLKIREQMLDKLEVTIAGEPWREFVAATIAVLYATKETP